MKDKLLADLNSVESSLKDLKDTISRTKGDFISKIEIKQKGQLISKKWFEEIENVLKKQFSFEEEILSKYHSFFEEILKFSLSNNYRKSSMLKTLNSVLKDFRKIFYIRVIKSNNSSGRLDELNTILEHVTEEEKEYLLESIKCAQLGFFRASIILGWCAAVDRMHKVVGLGGIDKFNEATKKMSEMQEGRYKRYSSRYHLLSQNELRTVFDSHLLWVLEYLQKIDLNEHDRLEICFTIRNNCAHPGDAPLSEPNLISFFSDLDNIIFNNKSFNI